MSGSDFQATATQLLHRQSSSQQHLRQYTFAATIAVCAGSAGDGGLNDANECFPLPRIAFTPTIRLTDRSEWSNARGEGKRAPGTGRWSRFGLRKLDQELERRTEAVLMLDL
jgi:hypothetical protein